MDTFDAIKARRSIRRFSNQQVEMSKIEKMIEAGLHAPSTKNSQPWQLVVLEGTKKDELADQVLRYAKSLTDVNIGSTEGSCRAIKEAPILILVFNKAPRSGGERNIKRYPKKLGLLIGEILSVGACIENMLLAGSSLGLSTLWIGDLRHGKKVVYDLTCIADDLIAGIAIGYKSETAPTKKKKLLSGKVEFYK